MNKLKTILLALLAAALIAGGALLPAAAARFQEYTGAEQIRYGEMNAVELNLGLHQSNLPLLGKLSLLHPPGTAVAIDNSQASMSEEQVMEAVKANLAPYQDAGLICCDLGSLSFECAANYNYDALNPERHCVFWCVTISGNVDGQRHTGFLILDDETGMILTIDYNHRTDDDFGYEVEYQPEYLEPFCSIYFEGLDSSVFSAEALDMAQEDNSEYSRVYLFGDALYGEIRMEFFFYAGAGCSSGGFYNVIY